MVRFFFCFAEVVRYAEQLKYIHDDERVHSILPLLPVSNLLTNMLFVSISFLSKCSYRGDVGMMLTPKRETPRLTRPKGFAIGQEASGSQSLDLLMQSDFLIFSLFSQPLPG